MLNLHTLADSADIDSSNYTRNKAKVYINYLHELKKESRLRFFRLIREFPISKRNLSKLEFFASQNAMD